MSKIKSFRYLTYILSMILLYHFSTELFWYYENDLMFLSAKDLCLSLPFILFFWIMLSWAISFFIYIAIKFALFFMRFDSIYLIIHSCIIFTMLFIGSLHLKNILQLQNYFPSMIFY